MSVNDAVVRTDQKNGTDSGLSCPADSVSKLYPYQPVKAWCSVAILLIFSVLSILDRQIIALLVQPMKGDLGLTDTQLGLLQGVAFALFYGIAGLPIGWAVDRYPRRIIIYLGITLWSLSAAFCGLARAFWQLFFGRIAVGVGEATMAPVAVSLISDLFPPDRVATPYGVYSAGYYVGTGVALALGGFIVNLFIHLPFVQFPLIGEVAPWQAVFIVTGLPGTLLALLAFLIYDPRRGTDRGIAPKHSSNIFSYLRARSRVTAHAFLGFGMAAFGTACIGSWTPAFFSRQFGMDPGAIGWTLGLATAVSGATGALLGGLLIDRVRRAGRRDAYFLMPAIGALLAVPFLTGAYFMPTPMLALTSLAIGLPTFGVISAASYATWRKIAPPELHGQITAAAVLFMALVGGALGPLAVALVTDNILQNEMKLGSALSLVVGTAMALTAILLLSGRKALEALPD